MRIKFLGCSILLLASSVFASNSTIYKWVDDNGVVHFSNSHPVNKESTEVEVQVSYTSNKEVNELDNLLDVNKKKVLDQKNKDLTEKNLKMFADNCQSAQANKKILTSFNKILIKDENDNDKLLTGEDLIAQLDLTNKHIDIYCEDDKK